MVLLLPFYFQRAHCRSERQSGHKLSYFYPPTDMNKNIKIQNLNTDFRAMNDTILCRFLDSFCIIFSDWATLDLSLIYLNLAAFTWSLWFTVQFILFLFKFNPNHYFFEQASLKFLGQLLQYHNLQSDHMSWACIKDKRFRKSLATLILESPKRFSWVDYLS